MVWKIPPTKGRMEAAAQATAMCQSLESWCWQDPELRTGPWARWDLEFTVETTKDGYLVLTLVPRPQASGLPHDD